MKRLIAGIIILLIAVGSAVTINLKICKNIDHLTEIAVSVRENVEKSEETDSRQTKLLTDGWTQMESFMAAFLPHSELDDIEIGIKNIENYHKQGLTDEYLEELNGCINRLEHIKESEKPVFKNIF